MTCELAVVGLVYFEIDCPRVALAPRSGQELWVARLPVRLGGCLNTASVAAALGVDAAMAHPRGDGLTDVAAASVVERLGLRAVTWPSGPDPAVSLVFRDGGDRAFVSAADLGALAACPPLPAARWIHVAGLHEAYAVASRLAEARRRGATISVSASWAPDLLAALRRERDQPWDLLFMNGAELARAAAGVDGDEPPWRAVAGAARELVVTHGGGAALYRDGVVAEAASEPVEVVDATGAGDAFVAGVIAGRLRGRDDPAALALGVAAARRILGVAGGVALDPTRFADLRPDPAEAS
ncbi:MAG: carbohydrate kinase family protein [Kofleriaceae bacterium]|nr:carbohydrate kinase family protein [Kofleriaceae bacterium]